MSALFSRLLRLSNFKSNVVKPLYQSVSQLFQAAARCALWIKFFIHCLRRCLIRSVYLHDTPPLYLSFLSSVSWPKVPLGSCRPLQLSGLLFDLLPPACEIQVVFLAIIDIASFFFHCRVYFGLLYGPEDILFSDCPGRRSLAMLSIRSSQTYSSNRKQRTH